ncbi:MAG: hypothetical protein V1904_05620 [Bacteroidota bacterium]
MQGPGPSNIFTTCTLNDGDVVVVLGTDALGCSAFSNSITVAVNPLPTAYNVTGGGTYCSGGPGLPIGISGSDIGVDYYLYCNGVYSGPTITGTGAPISFGNQTTACCYTVVAQNATTACQNNMNGSSCVTINPSPAVYNVTGGGSYCSGGAGVSVGLSDSDSGVNYQLQCNGVSVGGLMSGTGSALGFGYQTTACCYTVVAINAFLCSDTMNGNACVTINPNSNVTVTVAIDTICPGDCSTITAIPNGGCPPYLYQWSLPPGGNLPTIVVCPAS